jgi:hypothetical protein
MGILDDAIREHLELKRRHGADSQEVSRQEREILGADGNPAAPAAPVVGYDDGTAPEDGFVAEVEAPPVVPTEPLAGSPLVEAEPAVPPMDDLFPGTGELMQAAAETPVTPPAPAAPSPSLAAPAPSGADSETAARSGARRLSDDELAAWRRRLSERADRLAAQRPGTEASAPATAAGEAAAPVTKSEPPAYWSGNTTGSDAGAPPSLSKPAPAAPTPPPAPPADSGQPGVPVDFFDAGDAEGAFAPEKAPEPAAEDHDVLDETPDFLEETPEHDRMWFEQRPPRDFDFG